MMKKVFALVVAAAMGLSSAAFAVQAATPVVTSNAATQSAPAKSTHMKTHHMKKNTEQKAQAANKHHKASGKKSPAQKAQAAKKHHKKSSKKVTTPAA